MSQYQYIPYTGPPGVHIPQASNGSPTINLAEVARQPQQHFPHQKFPYQYPHQQQQLAGQSPSQSQPQQQQQHGQGQQPQQNHGQHGQQQHRTTTYAHAAHPPPPLQAVVSSTSASTTVMAPIASTSASTSMTTSAPVPATAIAAPNPDWAKDLIQLAKTSELKKHALTLQLHTAHILSAHASVDQKSRMIQDIREEKNRLDSERARHISALAEINKKRDQVDMAEANLNRECTELRTKIDELTEGDYASAKGDVDRLRQELGQEPLPSLQSILDERAAQSMNERRFDGHKRRGDGEYDSGSKRPRGRPRGSRNRTKEDG